MKKILLFLLLAALPAYAQDDDNAPSPLPKASSGKLQTYTNDQYHFTLQYPGDFYPTGNPVELSKTLVGVIEPFVTLIGTLSNCDEKTFCIYPSVNPNYYGPSFAMNVSAEPTYEECIRTIPPDDPRFSNHQNPTEPVTINGNVWYKDSYSEGGQFTGGTYRTYFNGTCYEIYLLGYSLGYWWNGKEKVDVPREFLLTTSQSILNSVRFTVNETAPTKHDTDLPAWKTYTGKKMPVSFTYPGNFFVIEKAEVAANRISGIQTKEIYVGPGRGLEIDDSHSIHIKSQQFRDPTEAISLMNANLRAQKMSAMTLSGENAHTSSDPIKQILLVRGSTYYEIWFTFTPTPKQYKTFVKTFKFTSPE